MELIKKEVIQRIVESVAKVLAGPSSQSYYYIVDKGVPHQPERLPEDKMGICVFYYNNTCLMIGKSGPNSSPRFLSQHYNPNSAPSTLARSILNDNEMNISGITVDNIGGWIKKNCRRIDVIIDKSAGTDALQSVKIALHQQFEPKYGRLK